MTIVSFPIVAINRLPARHLIKKIRAITTSHEFADSTLPPLLFAATATVTATPLPSEPKITTNPTFSYCSNTIAIASVNLASTTSRHHHLYIPYRHPNRSRSFDRSYYHSCVSSRRNYCSSSMSLQVGDRGMITTKSNNVTKLTNPQEDLLDGTDVFLFDIDGVIWKVRNTASNILL